MDNIIFNDLDFSFDEEDINDDEEILFEFEEFPCRGDEAYCKQCVFNSYCKANECIEEKIDDIISNTLTPRELRVIFMYYGLGLSNQLPKTKEYIGREFNVPSAYIDSILAKAIYKLKKLECFMKLTPFISIVHNEPNSGYHKLFKKAGLFNRMTFKCEKHKTQRRDLGEILYIELNQYCETKKMFDLYNGYKSQKQYDTLLLKTAHTIVRYENDKKQYISFYVKRKPFDDSKDVNITRMTITEIKKMFSSGRFTRVWIKETGETQCLARDKFRKTICEAITNVDANGDYFFEIPFSFNALNRNDDSASTNVSKYYIVGFNLTEYQ